MCSPSVVGPAQGMSSQAGLHAGQCLAGAGRWRMWPTGIPTCTPCPWATAWGAGAGLGDRAGRTGLPRGGPGRVKPPSRFPMGSRPTLRVPCASDIRVTAFRGYRAAQPGDLREPGSRADGRPRPGRTWRPLRRGPGANRAQSLADARAWSFQERSLTAPGRDGLRGQTPCSRV